jgi:hypothetical protein
MKGAYPAKAAGLQWHGSKDSARNGSGKFFENYRLKSNRRASLSSSPIWQFALHHFQ